MAPKYERRGHPELEALTEYILLTGMCLVTRVLVVSCMLCAPRSPAGCQSLPQA